MRQHKTDPSVTVIMETVGSNPDKIVGAIQSVIGQTYQDITLLIINYHPERLRICGKVPANIEILNAEDVFLRRVHQHAFNLKQVRTDCWTVCDDDDIIDPTHIADMVEFWNTCTDRTPQPLQVCGQHYAVHYQDRVDPLTFKGWAVSLFERLTPAEVDLVYKNFPQGNVLGSDTWIAWNSYFDKRLFEGKRTYHWDRTGSNHVSNHETNKGRGDREKFQQALNYWRIKIEARARPLDPIILD